MNQFLKFLLVVVSSSLLYYFSSGFDTIWLFAWFAPIPVLVYAYQERFVQSALATSIVSLAPGLNQLIGYWPTHIPAQGFVISMLYSSIVWLTIVLLSRFVSRSLNSPVSMLAYPSLIALEEWLGSLGPQGSFGSISYSQLHFIPAIQIAAITGFYGISFILSLFASGITYAVFKRNIKHQFYVGIGISFLSLAVDLGYGLYHIHQNHEQTNHSIKVGMVSIGRSPGFIFNSVNAQQALASYKPYIDQLSKQGAQWVLLPEESLTISNKNSQFITNQLTSIAKNNHIYLIIGENVITANARFNSALMIDPEGKILGTYQKRHFVPLVEVGITPGKGILTFAINNLLGGIAICRDMDYTYPALNYGQAHANLLFVPAWDFLVDADVHDSGAIMRGVENGYTIVRNARAGYMSVSLATGKIIARQLDINPKGTILLADAPLSEHESYYAKHPHAFVIFLWFSLIGVCIALLRSFMIRKHT